MQDISPETWYNRCKEKSEKPRKPLHLEVSVKPTDTRKAGLEGIAKKIAKREPKEGESVSQLKAPGR